VNNLKLVLGIILLPVLIFGQTERWVYTYNGSANGTDVANAIVYGSDGNVYTAGSSYDSTFTEDLLVTSITSSGSQRWIYRYNGTGNSNDGAYSIVYGTDGNIYVAGYSWDNNYDIIVISLTSAGTQRWVYRYNGTGNLHDRAYSIVYGLDNNIYVAGSSTGNATSEDFTVISLTTSGTQRWVYTFNGPTNSQDVANALVYGFDGNIYAVGFITILAQDFAVISLTPAGTQRWVYTYDNPLHDNDYGWSIAYGLDNNVYACGFCTGPDTTQDYFVTSLTNAGSERWTYRYNNSVLGNDQAYHIIYGRDNNIYTVGFTSGVNFDIKVISLTPSGSQRWTYTYNGTGNDDDEAYALAFSSDSTLYVAGYTRDTASDNDFVVLSLSRAGSLRWLYTKNGIGNYYDYAYSIACGADNNIYAAGLLYEDSTYEDLAVISLTRGAGVEEYSAPRLPQSAFRFTASTIQTHNLTYQLSAPEPLTLKLALYNIQGEKIKSWQNSCRKGNSYYTKNIPALSSGIYFLNAETHQGYKESKKLVIIR
jgi:uncharacterized delta-60 repeat protein